MLNYISGIVFFTIRWWNPETFAAMHPAGRAARVSWPYVEDKSYLWTWLFVVPLIAYTLWQILYFLIVDVLRRQRLLQDPEVMTSYRFEYVFLKSLLFCLFPAAIILTYLILDCSMVSIIIFPTYKSVHVDNLRFLDIDCLQICSSKIVTVKISAISI